MPNVRTRSSDTRTCVAKPSSSRRCARGRRAGALPPRTTITSAWRRPVVGEQEQAQIGQPQARRQQERDDDHCQHQTPHAASGSGWHAIPVRFWRMKVEGVYTFPGHAGEGLGAAVGPGVPALVHSWGRNADGDQPRPLRCGDARGRRCHQGHVQRQGCHRRQAAADKLHAAGRRQRRPGLRQGHGQNFDRSRRRGQQSQRRWRRAGGRHAGGCRPAHAAGCRQDADESVFRVLWIGRLRRQQGSLSHRCRACLHTRWSPSATRCRRSSPAPNHSASSTSTCFSARGRILARGRRWPMLTCQDCRARR